MYIRTRQFDFGFSILILDSRQFGFPSAHFLLCCRFPFRLLFQVDSPEGLQWKYIYAMRWNSNELDRTKIT